MVRTTLENSRNRRICRPIENSLGTPPEMSPRFNSILVFQASHISRCFNQEVREQYQKQVIINIVIFMFVIFIIIIITIIMIIIIIIIIIIITIIITTICQFKNLCLFA